MFVLLILTTFVASIRGDAYCTGGPSVWSFPVLAAQAPAAEDFSNDCPLPLSLDPNIYYINPNKTQKRPWDSTGDLVVNGPGAGWALDPENAFGCMVGGWCPYACKAGYIESQFDNMVGQPWAWQTSCNGENIFVGAGRRSVDCEGGMLGSPCAGGEQGLYCNANKQVSVQAPSSTSSLGYTSPCIPSAPGTEIVNTAPFEVSTCRTIFPGSEIPQIPTTAGANQTVPLTVPPVYINGEPAWWTAGRSNSAGLQHYFMTPNQCLEPVCQWVLTRPATGLPSVGGIDYSPYILEVAPSGTSQVNGYNIAIRINCDSSLGDPEANAGNSYDTSLGNPGYGVRLYDAEGNLQCDAFWTGPAVKSDCSTICRGDRCANAPCSGSDCAMAAPDCSSVQCSSTPVQPVILDGNGNPFATGTGLIQACSVAYDIDNNVGKSIRVEVYQTANIGLTSAPGSNPSNNNQAPGNPAVVSSSSSKVSSSESTATKASSTTSATHAASSTTKASTVAASTTTKVSSSTHAASSTTKASTVAATTATKVSSSTHAASSTIAASTTTKASSSTHATSSTTKASTVAATTTKVSTEAASTHAASTTTKVTTKASSSSAKASTTTIASVSTHSTSSSSASGNTCPGALPCVSSSGVITCYQPTVFSCDNGFLCPLNFLACGESCYSASEYQCVNGALV